MLKSKLKAVTQTELEMAVQDLQDLEGSRFQEFQATAQVLGLGFYHDRDIHWVLFDLQPVSPAVVRTTAWPARLKSKTTPLGLFLRAHFLGRRLELNSREY